MKLNLSIIAVTAAVLTETHASILQFNTFGDTGCSGFEENVSITQSGHNANDFGGGRKSFEILASDGRCQGYFFTGRGQSGSSVSTPYNIAVGTCVEFPGGSDMYSFDVVCD